MLSELFRLGFFQVRTNRHVQCRGQGEHFTMTSCHLLSWERGAVCKAMTFPMALWHFSASVAHLTCSYMGCYGISSCCCPLLQWQWHAFRQESFCVEQAVVAKGHVTILTPLMWWSRGEEDSEKFFNKALNYLECYKQQWVPAVVLVINTRLWEQLQVRPVPLSSAFALLPDFPPLSHSI